MRAYLDVILQALVLFPIAAALLTLPFTIHHYRKYGSVTFLRVFLVYSFVLYLICAYFLVILPLPDKEEVAKLTTPTVQLIPMSFFRDLPKETGFRLTEPGTYLGALASNFTLQFVFNIALLFPLGFYLRYYFRRKKLSTIVICFCVSLFFELTQLSGLYGIYPRPYRLFDVDDLICNALGGFLGWLFAGPLLRILPDRDRIDEKSYQKGERVTFTRRFLALCVDIPFVVLLSLPISLVLSLISLDRFAFGAAYLLYFGLLQWLWKGKSLGKRLTKICVASQNGGRPALWRSLLRYGSVLCIFGLTELLFYLISSLETLNGAYVLLALFLWAGAALGLTFWFFVETALNRRSDSGRDYLHGRISGTRLVSTVQRETA